MLSYRVLHESPFGKFKMITEILKRISLRNKHHQDKLAKGLSSSEQQGVREKRTIHSHKTMKLISSRRIFFNHNTSLPMELTPLIAVCSQENQLAEKN